MTPTDAQLAPIRDTIRAAIEEWQSTCRVKPDKRHTELEALLVGAILAMQQSGLIVAQVRETP